MAVEDSTEHFDCFLLAAFLTQPSWGFGKAPDEDGDCDSEAQLNGDWHAPADRAISVRETEVNPRGI